MRPCHAARRGNAHRVRIARALLASLALVLAGAVPALAQEPDAEGALVIQTKADVDVAAGTHRDLLVVIDGDARIAGVVETAVVVNGTVRIAGGRVETLFVATGAVEVTDGAVVGEIRTLDSTYAPDPGVTVRDYAVIDASAVTGAFVPLAIVTWLGVTLTFLVAGLVVAAVGGAQIRRAGALMTEAPAPVLAGALASIVGLPTLAILAFITVVGLPAGFALLLVVLPLLWFLGVVAVAARIGDWIVLRLRGSLEPSHPLLATAIGLVVVGIASVLPVVAFLVGIFGMGAITVVAWRAAISRRPTAPTGAPAPHAGAQPV